MLALFYIVSVRAKSQGKWCTHAPMIQPPLPCLTICLAADTNVFINP